MKRPWMRIWIADYLQETAAHLNLAEHGALLLLLMIAWHEPDGSLPNDMTFLKGELSRRSSKLHGHTFNKLVPPLLDRYFVLGDDGRWRNEKLSLELQNAAIRSAKAIQSAIKKHYPNNYFNGLRGAPAVPTQSERSASQKKKERKEEAQSNIPIPDALAMRTSILRTTTRQTATALSGGAPSGGIIPTGSAREERTLPKEEVNGIGVTPGSSGSAVRH